MLDHKRLFEPPINHDQIGVVVDDTSGDFKLILKEHGPVILCCNCSVFVVFVFCLYCIDTFRQ
jgi:hypothetical protein